jgi:hypothetical protein
LQNEAVVATTGIKTGDNDTFDLSGLDSPLFLAQTENQTKKEQN